MVGVWLGSGKVGRTIALLWAPFAACAAFSAAINVLMLTGSLFMLQVYDRVLTSRSLETLQVLLLLVLVLYLAQGVLEAIRSRLFARIGQRLDAELGAEAFTLNLNRHSMAGARISPLRDLEQLRAFLASGAPSALFDLPWMPLYILLLFLLHPAIGVVGVIGVAALALITWTTERMTEPRQQAATASAAEASTIANSALRNTEIVGPLGLEPTLSALWKQKNRAAGAAGLGASDVAAGLGAASRVIRMSLQSGVLALGAFLVIQGEATGGVMIASSILLGRALAPVELAISHWRNFVSARQAYRRLDKSLDSQARDQPNVALPGPSRGIAVEQVWVAAPGSKEPSLKGVHFELEAGDALGVVGPSGSGKSTLARALVGVWPAQRGAVRFDGATLDQWAPASAARFTGYLPQAVELFDGSIGWNIARLDQKMASDDVLAAARTAGLEDFIRRLPDGFDTPVGEGGERLSAGQRQRVALARALYRDPFFVVLDEPNSALDAEGEAALTEAIWQVRRRGGIAVVIAHRPSALQAVNKVLMLREGGQVAFGPKDDVLKRVLAPVADRDPEARRAEASS